MTIATMARVSGRAAVSDDADDDADDGDDDAAAEDAPSTSFVLIATHVHV